MKWCINLEEFGLKCGLIEVPDSLLAGRAIIIKDGIAIVGIDGKRYTIESI